jgi:sugar phosphate isomerase/epimerase
LLDIEVLRVDAETDIRGFEHALESGARLGARYAIVNVHDLDVGRASSRLAELGALAAQFGIAVVLEPMSYSSIRTPAEAVSTVAESNCAILVDVLHLARSGGGVAELLEIDTSLLPYVQLCDAPARPSSILPQGLIVESRTDRLPLGAGVLPLRDVVNLWADRLVPVSIEAPSTKMRAAQGDVSFARSLRRSLDDLLDSEVA